MALLALGQIQRAQELFSQELDFGRERRDPFVQKRALERLGLVEAKVGDARRGLAFLEEALALARAVGDRQHEADLLWEIAIQEADQGRHKRAAESARAAIAVLEALANPEARVLATHLQAYLAGRSGGLHGDDGGVGQVMAPAGESGPRLLRMGLSLRPSSGGGWKPVPPAHTTPACAARSAAVSPS